MTQPVQRTNPFYVVLVIVGLLFAVTACAYVVLMLNRSEMGQRARARETNSLLLLLERKGELILTVELAILAVATVAAIGTDGIWNPQTEGKQGHEDPPSK